MYFTGVPCSNGHLSPRYTSSGTCRSCILEYQERERAYIKKRRQEAKARSGHEQEG